MKRQAVWQICETNSTKNYESTVQRCTIEWMDDDDGGVCLLAVRILLS